MKVDKSAVWVFDLDDTLYKEIEYQRSGYEYISSHLMSLFKKDVSCFIAEAITNELDVLDEVCRALSLPASSKESLLWLYRLHMPDIKLESDVKDTLNIIRDNYPVAIITDGRSISQRNKLFSLGLGDVECFVSEEWRDVKPGRLRFQEIERRHPNSSQLIYVGDNIRKDFITPNLMGWTTIGIKDNGDNIHQQTINSIDSSYLPNCWVEKFSDIQDFLC